MRDHIYSQPYPLSSLTHLKEGQVTESERKLHELMGKLTTLKQLFSPHEINPGIRRIVRVINQANELAKELGEALTNGELTPQQHQEVNNLTAKVTLMMAQLTEKENVIARLEAELKKYKDAPAASPDAPPSEST